LYKLKHRFPIRIDLESSDIKEICYIRLLGKSPEGEKELAKLFEAHGQALRHNTKLQDAKYYDADFSKESFSNLYPFLPAHFDILLHLLGALAKSTGGVGLRSAIKIVQDVLRGEGGKSAMADKPVGWLTTTVTLFDELEKDIARAFASIYQAVGKVLIRFPDSPIHQEIAKSVAVLQILGNLPVSVQNVASLLHPSITAPSRQDEIQKAVSEMVGDPLVPLGEKDGILVFLSEKLRDIEQERASVALRSVDVKRVFNEAIRETVSPLPRVSLKNTLTVTSGLKVQSGSMTTSLGGESNAVQMIVEFVPVTEYEATKSRIIDESRSRTSQNVITLLTRSNEELDELANQIYRSQRIEELHRNEPDQEIREYCDGQLNLADRNRIKLQSKINNSLQAGSFIFRGQATAVSALDTEFQASAKKLLSEVADQVYDRYAEAPVRVQTDVAEKFLKVANPAAISSAIDPLGFVQTSGGHTVFRTDDKAMISIRDLIERQGVIDGKRLLDHFSSDPFGWSQDTARYIVSAMLMAGELKLKVSGRTVTTVGSQAIEALKTNNSFKSVGVSLREERPSNEILGRAAERLTELVGDTVLPLEQEISKAAVKHFPQFQHDYGSLAEKLSGLGIVGIDRARILNQDIRDILSTDASDVPQRLGAEKSSIFEDLTWALNVKRVFDNGLDVTVRDLQRHREYIAGLPNTGVLGELRSETEDEFNSITERLETEEFYKYSADFSTNLTHIKNCVREGSSKLYNEHKTRLKEGGEELRQLKEWKELSQEERGAVMSTLDEMQFETEQDLEGLKQLFARDYEINSQLDDFKNSIKRKGIERQLKRREEKKAQTGAEGTLKLATSITVPSQITSTEELGGLIAQLQEVETQSGSFEEIEITFSLRNGGVS
ncbi:MAG: BREX system P-loop protein BrxC, partial [Verrucomicrobia bacterium]|nr:BREX system P-loop protein BrxC [Verrucomicrobiota bacterium]